MWKYKNIIIFWFVFSALWGIYRLFAFPEFFSEVVAKPIIWLGVTLYFLSKSVIPASVAQDLKINYSQTKPIWKVLFLPAVFIVLYFFLINFTQIEYREFSLFFLLLTVTINFSTGIVEEFVYRGILYVWFLKNTDEISAFIFVQILFLLGHLPTLIINSSSFSSALIHAFFIVLIGALHTVVFRVTKSIYASSLTHGIWNSLVYYFLLS